MAGLTSPDRLLVRDVLTGDPSAWERLVRRVADTVWRSSRLLCRDEDEARAAFAAVIEALRADGFRRLAAFNGAGRIETFAALITRDVLAERLMRQVSAGMGSSAWAAFEHFFRPDIGRLLQRRIPGQQREEARRDAYQEVCLALIADNCRRLKAYGGVGSFAGFVLHTVDRLVIDFIRKTVPRRRQPDEDYPPPRQQAVSDAVWHALPADGPSPEEALLAGEDERLLTVAAAVLRQIGESLSEAERLYLRVALGSGEPLPAREVARLMRRPVDEVYKLKRRVMERLKAALEHHPAVKNWRASV
jgi:RNA polymerase sigma factor (sigma-70 family)